MRAVAGVLSEDVRNLVGLCVGGFPFVVLFRALDAFYIIGTLENGSNKSAWHSV